MAAELAPEIEVIDQWPESIRFRLPRRRLGRKRWLGVALLAAGLLLLVALASMIGSMTWGIRGIFQPWMFMPLVFLGIPTLGGLLPTWWGLGLLIGRRELLVRGGKLRTDERIGPFFYGKSWKAAAVERLNVTSVIPLDPRYPHPKFAKDLDALLVYAAGGQRGMLAWGYSHELLEGLAYALAAAVERAVAITPAERDAPQRFQILVDNDYRPAAEMAAADDRERSADDFAAGDDEHLAGQEVTLQPVGSLIEVEDFGDGLTVKVPPSGLWRGTSGLFAFSLVWNGILTLMTTCGVLSALGALPNDNAEEIHEGGPLVLGILGLFWLVGIAILLSSINMGRRRAAIAIAGDALMVIQSGPLGAKRQEWALADVREVVVGPSGMQVNDADVLELQIRDRDDKKFGMLSGRSGDELHWLASLLERKLRTLAPADEEPPAAPLGEQTATEPTA